MILIYFVNLLILQKKMILIYFVSLFILQIILFILSLKRKQKIIWKELFIIERISIISVILYHCIYGFLDLSKSWGMAGVIIIDCFAILIYVIMLIISIITRNILNKKILLDQRKSKVLIITSIVIVLFIVFTIIDIKPLIDERVRRKEFSNYVMTYLNNRYGNGNYKIKKIYNWNDCGLACLDMGIKNAYEFTIQSDYLDNNFTLLINIKTKKIEEDYFIEQLSEEKNWCENETSLTHCLENIILTEENKYISNVNDYRVNLSIFFDSTYGQTNYGKVPTIDDLKKEATITFDNFTIYKNFDDEDEFKNFMIEIYKTYLEYYKKYNNGNTISFEFINGNPFFEDYRYGYYKNGGYIKEQGEKIYIYNNASPIVVSLNEI